MKKQTITITTRASDGAMGIKINGRSVVTITKSAKKASIVGRNLKPHSTRHASRRESLSV